VLVYFECVPNPNAADTLSKYRDVECDTPEHEGAVAPMAIGLVLYVIGFFGLTAWANQVWPVRSKDPVFAARFAFLTSRWRNKIWYYGQAVMARNLLVATVGSMTPEPPLQITILVALMSIYMLSSATSQPWKARELNVADSCVSFLVVLIGCFGVVFLTLDTETDLYARFGQAETAAEKQTKLEDVAEVLLGIVCIFVASFCLLVVWSMYWLFSSQRHLAVQKHHAQIQQSVEKLKAVNGPHFVTSLHEALLHGTDYDRRGFDNAMELILDTMNAAGNGYAADEKPGHNGTETGTVSA